MYLGEAFYENFVVVTTVQHMVCVYNQEEGKSVVMYCILVVYTLTSETEGIFSLVGEMSCMVTHLDFM